MRLRATRVCWNAGRQGASVSPYAAFSAFVQSLYDGGQTGIWYDGTDATQRAVNSDGSGGVPADGAQFGWLNDKTGGGRPAIQATALARPIAATNGIVFQDCNAVTDGGPARALAPASGSGANMQASTGIIIFDFTRAPSNALPVIGWYTVPSYPCRYAFLAWRTGTTGNVDLYAADINQNNTPAAAIPTTACRAPTLGGSTSAQGIFYQYVQFNSRLSDANFLQLRTLAAQACGAANFSTNVVACLGDSNTYGYRSATGKSWPWMVAGNTNAKVYNFGVVGDRINGLVTMGNLPAIKGAGKNILLWTASQNDSSVTSYADVVQMYCAGMQRARQMGWATLAATYYSNTGANAAFNTALRPEQSFSFDYLCDFESRTELTDINNGTYFWPDRIHLRDAAITVAGNVASAAVASALQLPQAVFTATPRIGSTVNTTFANTSVGASSYAWDFTNDGSTDSTATNPTNNYTTTGTPDVKLTATNANGSSARIRRFYINVQPSPAWVTTDLVAGFIANAGQTSSGGFLSAWADTLGASGLSLAQATDRKQPAVDGSGIVTFDGVDDFLQTGASGSLGTRTTICLLAKINTATAGRHLVGGRVVNAMSLRLGSTTEYYVANQVDTASSAGVSAGAWTTLHAGYSADTPIITKMMMLDVEGQDTMLGDWLGGDTLAANGITLGARYDGSVPVAMSVKALLVYSAGLTRAQMAQNKAMAATL